MIHVPTRLDLIKAIAPGSVGAEIGVYRADFSQQVIESTAVAKLFLVDPWKYRADYHDTINQEDQQGHYEETIRKMRGAIWGKRVEVVRGFSAEVAKDNLTIPPLDFVFVDAYHKFEAAFEDITVWAKRLKPNGVLFCHDYFRGPKYGHGGNEWFSGVPEACDEFMRLNPAWKITHITDEDLPTVRLARE